ncbi:hypothetical protein [Xylella fastidiosa]|uniref:hypothetical protein n=1 Tax=Xylella fastidiosa TaxID=2371 RepID=UPI0034DF0702
MVPVLEIGRIWVICEDGCRPDDPVLIRIAGTGTLGAARSAAIASETIPYPRPSGTAPPPRVAGRDPHS